MLPRARRNASPRSRIGSSACSWVFHSVIIMALPVWRVDEVERAGVAGFVLEGGKHLLAHDAVHFGAQVGAPR